MTGLEMAQACREALEDKKGRDVVILDVSRLSSVTDYFVIASGSNAPHLRAMQQAVHGHLKEKGVNSYRESADADGVWFCMDYVDVVVHLMNEEAREYYGLESLWGEAPRV